MISPDHVVVLKGERFMVTNSHSKFSYLFIGVGLGAIGGLIAALFADKQSHESLRERGTNRRDCLNEQAGTLRRSADAILKNATEFIGPHCDSVENDTEAEKQTYREERRETFAE
jgi:gas vesicle protein